MELLSNFPEEYARIAKVRARPKIPNNNENLELVNRLQTLDYIGKFTPEGDFIQIIAKYK